MKRIFTLSLLALLLSFSSAVIYAQDSDGLAQAILNGTNTNRVATLIRQGADVNSSNTSGITPLMAAAAKGNVALVKLLLKKGANPNASIMVEGESLSAFDFALISGHYNLAKLLPAVGPDGKPLKGEARKLKIESDKEASKGYTTKRQLYKIFSWMDPVKTGLAMYFMENGGFPGKAETYDKTAFGKPAPSNSIWASLTFQQYPGISEGISSVSYIPFNVRSNGTAASFGIVITLDNFGSNTLDDQLLGLSPSNDMVITGPGKATSKSGRVPASTASLKWYYSCHQMTAQPVAPQLREIFSNDGVPMVCR